MDYLAPYVKNRFVEENPFRSQAAVPVALPPFETARQQLPQPFWEQHDSVIACYWKAWELAFRHVHLPTPQNGFVTPYIDTVFEDEYSSRSLYMWDVAFVSLFARYAMPIFHLHHMLDNLYAKQHPDGYICRQIRQRDGSDAWHRFDPNGTGVNIFAWTEWLHYQHTGDQARLAAVFPALVGYHQWMRRNRTWRDGSYWATGLSSMDNLPRFSTEFYYGWQHDHLIWVDICLQQVLSARTLISIADLLGRSAEVEDMRQEADHLTRLINTRLWDEADGFYYDLRADEQFVRVKSLAAYWALLAEVVSPTQLARLVVHLENPAEFKRPHRVPALSADDPDYRADGDYWRGGVWSPTNYMVIAGLHRQGCSRLAHEIARNHVEQVAAVFDATGTLWENYAPEMPAPGNPSLPDLVGWTGLSAISVLLESVLGLSYQHSAQRLTWQVHLLEAHGVTRYPLNQTDYVTLRCERRTNTDAPPAVFVESTLPITLEVRWGLENQHQHLISFPVSSAAVLP